MVTPVDIQFDTKEAICFYLLSSFFPNHRL
jgi:hypothetical protein